jgi:O-antigen/teichoic acid export membrane protein
VQFWLTPHKYPMKAPPLVRKFTDRVLLYLAKGGFLKAIAKLSGATVLGQVVSILASLLLTRLYTPGDFGILGVFTAIATQLTVFICMRYEWAILPAKDDRKAADLLFLSCLITIVVTAIITAVSFTCSEQIALWLKVPALAKFLWLMPIATLCAGLFQIFNYWALRHKDFSIVAKAQVAKSLWSNGIQIGLGFLHLGALGLLIGYVVNQFAGLKPLLSFFWRNGKQYLENYSIANSIAAGKEYIVFVASCVASSFFNYAAMAVPAILLAFYYGTEEVGLFALAQRITSIPAVLISNSVSQVYFANACELIHTDPRELGRLYARTTMLLFGISLLVGCGLLLAPWIVPTLFGQQWQRSGTMCQYMAPMLLSTLCVSPLTMLEWLNQNVEILVWHSIRLTLIIMGFYLSNYYHLSLEVCIGIFSCITAVSYAILFLLNKHAIDRLINGTLKI